MVATANLLSEKLEADRLKSKLKCYERRMDSLGHEVEALRHKDKMAEEEELDRYRRELCRTAAEAKKLKCSVAKLR